jgi:hypothetical protein
VASQKENKVHQLVTTKNFEGFMKLRKKDSNLVKNDILIDESHLEEDEFSAEESSPQVTPKSSKSSNVISLNYRKINLGKAYNKFRNLFPNSSIKISPLLLLSPLTTQKTLSTSRYRPTRLPDRKTD